MRKYDFAGNNVELFEAFHIVFCIVIKMRTRCLVESRKINAIHYTMYRPAAGEPMFCRSVSIKYLSQIKQSMASLNFCNTINVFNSYLGQS